MTLLTAGEIAELRVVQESAMPDTCTISDPAHKSGEQGQEWTLRGGSVVCGVSSLSQAFASNQISYVPDFGPNQVVRVFALPITVAPIDQGARIDWSGEQSADHYYVVRTVELPGSYAMQVSAVAVRTRSSS